MNHNSDFITQTMARLCRWSLLLLIFGVTLAACSNPLYSDKAATDRVAVRSVKVSPQTIELFAIGETKDLTASVSPADATDQAVSWESSDATVASVDANGRVTARAVGFGVF